MADPQITQILDVIEARLANLTMANGYFYDVKKIKRATAKPPDGIDYPSIRYWAVRTQNAVEMHGQDLRTIPIYIEYRSKTYDEPFNDVVAKLESDIVNGVNRDVSAPKVSDEMSIDLEEDDASLFADYLEDPKRETLAAFRKNLQDKVFKNVGSITEATKPEESDEYDIYDLARDNSNYQLTKDAITAIEKYLQPLLAQAKIWRVEKGEFYHV